jgi:hypothetical protein
MLYLVADRYHDTLEEAMLYAIQKRVYTIEQQTNDECLFSRKGKILTFTYEQLVDKLNILKG